MDFSKNLKPNLILFLLGFLGIVSVVPVIPKLLGLQPEPLPFPIEIIQLISVVQSSFLLLFMLVVGSIFSRKVNLHAPVIVALTSSHNALSALKPQIFPAIKGGILGGILITVFFDLMSSELPAEFLSAAEKLTIPWYAKLLYGGITEELLIRWGLMSFFVWGIYRLTQKPGAEISAYNYILGIILAAVIFGLGHLPIALTLSSEISASLIIYIVLGNAVFGFIAGYLYWKRGLECAIGAHMIAHITMTVVASLL